MPSGRSTQDNPKRIRAEFDRDAACKHNTSAYACGYKECNPAPDRPLDAITQTGKTIKEVIGDYVGDGRIPEIELDEHIRGTIRWQKVTNFAKVTGKVVGIAVVVVGSAVVLRLIRGKDEPTSGTK